MKIEEAVNTDNNQIVPDFAFEQPGISSRLFTRENILNAVSVTSLFAIWWLLTHYKIYRFGFIPGPVEVYKFFIVWVKSAAFWKDVSLTTLRVFGGVTAACFIAIPVGLMIGWNKVFADFTFPTLEILRPIPGIAYIPLAILFFPWEEASVAFICFIGAFFPILLNTITGVKLIDRDYFRAAQCLGSTPAQIFRHVVVPGALPSISTGVALGMGIGWMASVAGEMISGKWGLGYRIWEAYTLFQYEMIVCGMIVIGALGFASSALIRYLAMQMIPWQKAITEPLNKSITR